MSRPASRRDPEILLHPRADLLRRAGRAGSGALLRYRNAGGGTVAWSYELFAPDLVVKEEFDRICAFVKTRNRTLYLGTPDKP